MHCHNFLLGHIEVEVQGRAYDLHNFYNAEAIRHDVLKGSLTLTFNRLQQDWVPAEEARQIILSFSQLSYFCADAREMNAFESDLGCVHAIGVVEAGAATETFYLTDQFPADHHLVIEFTSGLILRLRAQEAQCALFF